MNCKFTSTVDNGKIYITCRSETDKLFDDKYDTHLNNGDIISCQRPYAFLQERDCREYIMEHIQEAKGTYHTETDTVIATIPFTKKNLIVITLHKKPEGYAPIMIGNLEYESVFEWYYPEWKTYEDLIASPVGQYVKIYDEARAVGFFDETSRQPEGKIYGKSYTFKYFNDHGGYRNNPDILKYPWEESLIKHKNANPTEKIISIGQNNISVSYTVHKLIKVILDGWLYKNHQLVAFRLPKIIIDATDDYCRVSLLRCKEYVICRGYVGADFFSNNYHSAEPIQSIRIWKEKVGVFNIL